MNQLLAHLTRNNLETNQSAYKRKHSTETALLKLNSDILSASDSGQLSILTLLDLSAVFDTIDHAVLLRRLKVTYGIEGNALKWFDSYITNRSQTVRICNHVSSSTNLSYGVPQGSVLGPILFSLYIQPLSKVIRYHDFQYHSYADDTQIYYSFDPCNLKNTIDSLNVLLKSISN